MLLARLVITVAVLLICTGLLFHNPTEVSTNIANGVLGALIGYWFSTDGTQRTQTGGLQINATGHEHAGAPRAPDSDTGNP